MLIGRRLSDRYKIIEIIGGGGMANVYLARDMILEREVAIKVLRMDFSNDEEFIKRFRREAHSATSLAHPNIVSIYDVGEEDDIYYIVMEYVAGKTLKQYIQHNAPLSAIEASNIMEQLTSAISHAHQNHIIHRDIKPQNILIDDDGVVKVTDFGIAIALSSTTITQTNSILGSVHYLSPEQARGGMANETSDIYSLGIVMFELLTGRLPFSGESAVSIALKHLQSDTPSPKRWNSSIPQSVENIILKATAKDPFHRYKNVEEMEQEIITALHPDKMNEKKFVVPNNNEEITKVIPVIYDHDINNKYKNTVIHSKKKVGGKTPKPKRGNKLAMFIITTFLLLAASGVAAVTIFPSLMLPEDVTVPDLTNKEYANAVKDLLSLGFNVEDTKDVEDEKILEGYVVRTNPRSGEIVKEGTSITIYNSIGKKKVEFDNYINRNINDVEKIVEKKNFANILKNEVYDELPPGTIIDQSPKAGDLVVPDETEVTFKLSKGLKKITLKNLKDYTEVSVNDYIEEVGLNLIRKEEYSDTFEKGLVISQNPEPNSELNKGDTITVTFSLGKEEQPPKTVTRQIQIPYEPSFDGEIKDVYIFIEDASHDMTDPYKILQITKSEIEIIDFFIPYGKNAVYKVIIDDQVVAADVINYPEEAQ